MNAFLELEDSLFCILGILPSERTTPQKINWHLRFEITLPKTDSIEDALDYTLVKAHVRKIAHGNFHLIETLGQTIIDSLFKTFPIHSATLRLNKEICRSTLEISR